MTVADVVAGGVRRAGVARVFAAGDVDVALLAALAASHVPIIRARGAADACAMAAVTGRLGEGPGVALVGREASGVARVLAAALRDRAPLVIVAAEAPPAADALKAVATVSADSASHWIAHAMHAAGGEPPGPVWLTVSPQVATCPAVPVATRLRPVQEPIDAAAIDRVAAAIGAAARPLIVAGRQCRVPGTAPWLRALAESLPAPVLVTPAARGALPDPHPLCFGRLHAGSGVLARADLVLALGVGDEELVDLERPLPAPVARVGATHAWAPSRADVCADVVGDVAGLLEELAARLRARERADWDVAELDRIRRSQTAAPGDGALAQLVARLREATPVGTAAVFARALRDGAAQWQAVAPGDVLEDDRPLASAVALALAREHALVLAFGVDDPADPVVLAPEGAVEILTPGPGQLAASIDAAVTARARARVLIVPRAG